MPRYKLTIAYDGTDFCGWQKQEPPAGSDVDPVKVLEHDGGPRLTLRTVQEVVEQAVREVVREPVSLHGASRTDSGVHARGQVGAFTCGDGMPPVAEPPTDQPPDIVRAKPNAPTGWPLARGADRLVLALNSRLPDDVAIVAAAPVDPAFNPISDCTAKGYSYTLHVSPQRAVFDRRYVHHVWVPLNLDDMRRAAERIVGEHDFAAFAAAGHGRLSTVRTVFECRVEEERIGGTAPTPDADWSRRLRIEISGNGFLYNMVRIVAGTLLEVGRGRLSPDDVSGAIASLDRRHAGPTLPPTGLCLEWIRYA